jgi:hypothetical protein
MMKRVVVVASVLFLALGLGAQPASSNDLTIYSAKFVCGDTNQAVTGADTVLTPADNRTAVNIHNPNTRALTITKQIVFTELGSTDGNITDISGQSAQLPDSNLASTHGLGPLGAVEWDCEQLYTALNNAYQAATSRSNTFAKGFLIVTGDTDDSRKAGALNIVAVYTSRGKDSPRPVTLVVQEVKGRVIEDGNNERASTHHEDGGEDSRRNSR